jgi:tetratricopeptide (TPR) repeat protein
VVLTGGNSRAVAADVALLYEAGQDYASAARHFHFAARNTAGLFAYPETVNLAERGLRALSSVAESRERDEQELALLQVLALSLMATRGYAAPEVEKVHRRSLELCLGLNETRRLMPVLWGLHTCETNAGNLETALKLAHQMRDLAESTRETTATVQSLHAFGTTLAFMGRLNESREALERIFTIQPLSQQSAGPVYLLDPSVTSLSMLARLLALMGYLDQAMERAALSVEAAQRLAHPQSIAYATFWVGWVHHARGEYEQCCRHVEPAMSFSQEHGLALFQEWGRVVRGSALMHLGRVTEGIAEIRKSMANQQSMGSLLERSYCLTLLAEALARQGANEEAVMLCDEALEFGRRTEGRCYEPETHRIRGELLIARGDVPAAEREFQKALRSAQERECRLLELRAAVSYYRLQEKVGDRAAGREVLTRVARWFVEGDSCPTLSEARSLIADVTVAEM